MAIGLDGFTILATIQVLLNGLREGKSNNFNGFQYAC